MGRSSRHLQSDSRFILTQVGCHRVAFPTALVAEIVLFERSRLLALPMYARHCMGVVRHRGTLMPLYSLRADPFPRKSLPGMLTAIRLGAGAGKQAGVGIEIDTLLGHISLPQGNKCAQVPVAEFKSTYLDGSTSDNNAPQGGTLHGNTDSVADSSETNAANPDGGQKQGSPISNSPKRSAPSTFDSDTPEYDSDSDFRQGSDFKPDGNSDTRIAEGSESSSVPLHIFSLDDISNQLGIPRRTIVSPSR
ncbi:MAG: chemotaxis protein CheW [Cyanobacteria bacterium P01_E01_bin.45]